MFLFFLLLPMAYSLGQSYLLQTEYLGNDLHNSHLTLYYYNGRISTLNSCNRLVNSSKCKEEFSTLITSEDFCSAPKKDI